MRPFIYVLISPIRVTLSDANKSGAYHARIGGIGVVGSTITVNIAAIVAIARTSRTRVRYMRRITCYLKK